MQCEWIELFEILLIHRQRIKTMLIAMVQPGSYRLCFSVNQKREENLISFTRKKYIR